MSLKTSNEILQELTEKIDALVNAIAPQQVQSNPELQSVLSKLDTISAHLSKQVQVDGYSEERLNAEIERFNKLISELEQLSKKMNSNPCIPEVEEETIEDKVFNKNRWAFVLIGTSITCILATVAFNYVVPAFVHTMGLFTTFLGFLVWLFVDKYLFKGDSIGKMGQTSIGVGLASIAIMGLYGIGVSIGNSYFSNPRGADNEKPQAIEQPYEKPKSDTTGQQQPSASRGNDVVLPERTGNPQGEQ